MDKNASIVVRQATESDFDAILALQRENTPDRMSEAQKRQGYIVSEMDPAQLAAINGGLGNLVAAGCGGDGSVSGFVCLSAADARPRPAVVEAMLEAARSASLNGQPLAALRLFLYGPVCVSAPCRGKGVLGRLFAAVKARMRGRFDAGLAFIAADNPHSLAAHFDGLGMEDVTRFRFRDKDYHLVAFSLM